MKIINKIIGVMLLVFLVSSVSCSIDTGPRNQGDLQPISKISDATKYYNGLSSMYRSTIFGRVFTTMETQCDMFNATRDYGNQYGPSHRIDASFTTADYEIEYVWASYYTLISRANVVLGLAYSYTPEAPVDIALMDYYIGAYHYFRAAAYHNLVRLFANAFDPATADTDLGVPVIIVQDLDERPVRSTISQTYQQIEDDIRIAAEHMNKFVDFCQNNPTAVTAFITAYLPHSGAIHPTIDAVKALNARVKLDMREFAQAAEITKGIIESGTYTLASTQAAMNSEWFGDAGKEAIYNFYSTKLEPAPTSGGAFIAYSALTGSFQPTFLPTQTAIDMYTSTDLRKTTWFMQVPLQFSSGSGAGYVLWKFRGNKEHDTNVNSWSYIFRPKVHALPEMLLINAEANAVLGLATDAAITLNALQTARAAVTTTGSLANVKEEWNKEMIGEGQRFHSLKRWNEGFSGRTPQVRSFIMPGGTANEESYNLIVVNPGDSKFVKFTWAIPSNDILNNPNIKGQQNPGW